MNRSTLWLAALLGILTPAAALAQQPQGPGYGPHMWNGGWHGWFFGPIMMIVLS
jgi:putative membrane protein